MNEPGGRKFRAHRKRWSSSRSSGTSSSGAVEEHSDEWWFWTKAGRKTWKKCKAKGKDSEYWKKHKCDRRSKPAKGSKWWWWTSKGRKVWKECKEKGEGSGFWKDNDCASGQ